MNIYLLNDTTVYPLAGSPGVAQSVHSSAGDVQIIPAISKQTAAFVRANNARTFDRKNLFTTLEFSTVRTFSTPAAAEQWAADYDGSVPRSGTIILESTAATGYPQSVIVAGSLTSYGSPFGAGISMAWHSNVVIAGSTYAAYGDATGYMSPFCIPCVATGGAWDGWRLDLIGPVWRSSAQVPSPDLVPPGPWHPLTNPHAWNPDPQAGGTPVLMPHYPGWRYLLEAVVEPPRRITRGCAVLLQYSVTGGAIVPQMPGIWSSEIPWPVGGCWEDS